MVKKRKRKSPTVADHGTPEAKSHGHFVEFQTMTAGVRGVRNVTATPLETYWHRKTISLLQYQAGDIFANQFDRAGLGARYSQSKYGAAIGGEVEDHHMDVIHDTKKRIAAALVSVGYPLAGVIEHVVGHGESAGSWSGMGLTKRPAGDGMVALRLALDGLVRFYRLG